MAKTLYLHIGFDKTGSTAIQHALVANKAVLNRHGFACFHRRYDGGKNVDGRVNDWLFMDDISDKKHHHDGIMFTEKLNELLANAAKLPQNHIILSAERFSCFFEATEIAKIHATAEKYFSQCKIIVYIRRQDKLMISLYQEYSKCATDPVDGVKALPTFAYKLFAYLDFNHRLLQWEQVFGQQNITIRVFEPTTLIGGDAVADFFHLLGIDEPVISERQNESNGFERTKMGHLLKQNLDNLYWYPLLGEYLDNQGKMLPSRAEAEAVYQLYRTSNQALNQRFGLSEENTAIFNEDFSDYPNEPADVWNEARANQAISNLLKAFNQLSPFKVFVIMLKTKLGKYPIVLRLWRLFRMVIGR